ncbi:MAG: energy transducer TonB [Sphingobacteriales bacterium]|nr:energy transducer TonB [Sphingobacteriales bacterium]MBI3717248.1 energy transducer TonB [Sphingobacteriales bacterium]
MTTQNILTADVLDIVFENRNKDYGAYTLRKYYDKRLMHSLGIMLLSVGSLILLSFRFEKKTTIKDDKPKATVQLIQLIPDQPKEIKEPEKVIEKPVPASKPLASVKARDNIVIVPDNKVTDNDKVPDQTEMENKVVSTVNSGGDNPNGQVVKPGDNNNGNGNLVGDEEPLDPKTAIDYADEPPTYPGGIEALQNFLRKNLRTPDELEAGQDVSVKVKFVVSNDGEMYGYEVVQSAGNAFNEEVLRVLKKMPKWNPGKYKGHAVSVYYIIPVKFQGVEE